MSYAAVRALFERVHALDAAQREALYRDEAVAPALRHEVEALLAASGDPIPALIGRVAEHTLQDTLPQRIGPWRVLGTLGEGGMGVVLRAERADGAFEMPVAIKLIRGHVSGAMRERFQRERQVLAALAHPDIAALIDGGTTASGEPYLVMPCIDGETLPQWLAREAPPLRRRLALFVRLCRAVQHAHQRLVVHRDLKPSNVMVRRDGSPVLLDFGIAKLLDASQSADATATRALTPMYASPEQMAGQPVTTATDVHGLGLILFEMLAGSMPMRGGPDARASQELPLPSQVAAAAARPALRAEAPRLRGDLDRIVRRALRSDPEQRYPSALALAEDVQAWLDGRPVRAAGAQSAAYVLRRFVGRHRLAVAASVIAVLLLATTALQWKRERDRARSAQALAQREAEAARGVTDFLVGLFAELDPENHPGRELAARELLDIGRERLDALDPARPELRARLELGLGEIYANAGLPEPAQALLGRADAALRDAPPTADAVRAASALARSYNLGRDSERALQSARRAITLAQSLPQPDPQALAHAHMVEGVALQGLDRGAEAEASFSRAEALFRALGMDAELASVQHNRAWLARARGEFREALALYESALARKRAARGDDHPSTLRSLHGRGMVLAQLGRHAEAVAVFEDLAERTARVHGPETEPMARAWNELASARQDLGEFAAAQRDYERALALERGFARGAPTMAVAVTGNNLGSLLEDRGDASGAERLYLESLALRETLLAEGHAGRINPLHNLARLQLDEGRLDAARRWGERAHAARVAALPDAHPLRLSSLALLARILAARRESEPARTLAAQFDAHYATLDAPLWTLQVEQARLRASLAALQGDTAAQADALAAAHAAMAASLPASHPRLARLALEQAEVLAALGREREARARLAALAPVLRAALVPEAAALARVSALERTLAPH